MLVSQAQRSRMLSSAVQVISECGYERMSVARVTDRAGVSRRTFYDLFADREDCFLAVFLEVAARARELMLAAYATERGWQAQTRAALAAFLGLLDAEPGMGSLLIVDALRAGSRVQEQRAQLIGELSRSLHEAGTRARPGRELPPITGEGVTGAVLGVIHTRLQSARPGPMIDQLNPLMGMIVLAYLGPAAAQRELALPLPLAPEVSDGAQRAHGEAGAGAGAGAALAALPMRITHRTLLVLSAIAERPGASNRGVAERAEVGDQGQMSKLLSRLQSLGLIENSGGEQPNGEPNQWHLTPRGQQVQAAIQAQASSGAPQAGGRQAELEKGRR